MVKNKSAYRILKYRGKTVYKIFDWEIDEKKVRKVNSSKTEKIVRYLIRGEIPMTLYSDVESIKARVAELRKAEKKIVPAKIEPVGAPVIEAVSALSQVVENA
jgi:hypothetical protein